jgi:arginyl-tRNA synthetase
MDPLADLRAAIGEGARLERPPKPDFGDYSTNAAMLRAPGEGKPPREVAAALAEELKERLGADVERIDVAGPGFLNLFMSDSWFHRAVSNVAGEGDAFGRGDGGERVLVEFVSANPTGPMTVASARGAAIGDSLSRLLEFAGNEVEREYYINDYGTQVRLFGESIRARARGEEPPEGGYQGGYVAELAAEIDGAAERDAEELAVEGVEHMMDRVKRTLERFRVNFGHFFSERSMYADGSVERVLRQLGEHVYEHEGARWLRTSSLGDEKDSVLIRSSGEPTYFASDIAYHEHKLGREYDRVINIWGADHHGHVKRMHASWRALGGEEDALELLIMQLVNLMEGGQRARMSKRQGEFVTLDDLIDDIGVDAARFFLLQRSHDTTIDLDLALAREQSNENPVYYCQYAHARIASILKRTQETGTEPFLAPGELHPSERDLIKKVLDFPEEIQIAAERRAPHRITTYVLALAQAFSAFYRDCKVVGTPEEPFRLALSLQTQRVIARSLDLLGVEAPESM